MHNIVLAIIGSGQELAASLLISPAVLIPLFLLSLDRATDVWVGINGIEIGDRRWLWTHVEEVRIEADRLTAYVIPGVPLRFTSQLSFETFLKAVRQHRTSAECLQKKEPRVGYRVEEQPLASIFEKRAVSNRRARIEALPDEEKQALLEAMTPGMRRSLEMEA